MADQSSTEAQMDLFISSFFSLHFSLSLSSGPLPSASGGVFVDQCRPPAIAQASLAQDDVFVIVTFVIVSGAVCALRQTSSRK